MEDINTFLQSIQFPRGRIFLFTLQELQKDHWAPITWKNIFLDCIDEKENLICTSNGSHMLYTLSLGGGGAGRGMHSNALCSEFASKRVNTAWVFGRKIGSLLSIWLLWIIHYIRVLHDYICSSPGASNCGDRGHKGVPARLLCGQWGRKVQIRHRAGYVCGISMVPPAEIEMFRDCHPGNNRKKKKSMSVNKLFWYFTWQHIFSVRTEMIICM